MLRLIVFFFSGIAAMAALTGCGETCQSLCEEAEGRGCNTFVLGTGSCAGDCDVANRLADNAGCGAQADARIDCEASQADICEAGCGAENQALLNCVQAYCLANPTDADCRFLAGI